MSESKSSELIHGARLASNSLLNLGTGLLIIALNIIFVPLMLHSFGAELYGVLSVTWMVLANLGWLDLGFSRASARYVSQELALGRPREAAMWTWTAVVSQFALGAAGSILLWVLAPWLVNQIHVQTSNHELVVLTLRLFAFSIPLDFANRSLTGVLQAGQRFDWVNGLSLFSTLSTFCVYAAGILRGADFRTVIYGLFGLRVVNLLAAYAGTVRVLPDLKGFSFLLQLGHSYWARAGNMVRYGCWVASAAIVGAVLLYFDQWMISALLGVALLPFYTVPVNLLSRLGLFPYSMTQTLFPAFSAMESKTEWERIDRYFVRAHRYLFTVLVPVGFVVFVWGREILRWWIGQDFASQAGLPLRILTFGFVIGMLAPLSGALLEAVGRPDVLVKLYLAELPFNVAIVWFLTKHYGVAGAAMSYLARNVVETVIVWAVVYHVVPLSKGQFLKAGLLRPGIALACFGLLSYGIPHATLSNRFDIVLTLLALAAYTFLARQFIFDEKDRALVSEYYRGKKEKFLGWRQRAIAAAE